MFDPQRGCGMDSVTSHVGMLEGLNPISSFHTPQPPENMDLFGDKQ
jgi:hypothetical protein